MSQSASLPVLSYFVCRGRAQPLIYMLEDSGQPYISDLEDMSNPEFMAKWAELKADKKATGPFGQRPSLRWGDLAIGQTEAIGYYLAKRLGYFPTESLEREAQCQMFMAAAYQDLHLPLIKLLWAPVWYPGCDMDSCVKNVKESVQAILKRFETELEAAGGPYLMGSAPTVADFFLYEGLACYGEMLGMDRLKELAPALYAFHQRISNRERMKAYLPKRPTLYTASPAEASVLKMFRESETA